MSSRSKRGLATWLTTSSSPLFLLNSKRVILVFNHGCEKLTGWPASELIGKTCHLQAVADPSLITSITGSLCPPEMDFTQPQGPHLTSMVRRDGEVISIMITFFPILSPEDNDQGHLLGMISFPNSASRPGTSVPTTEAGIERATGTATETGATSRRLDVARHTAHLFQKYQLARWVAESPESKLIASQIQLARECRAAVHLSGENGVGKEHLARLIHYHNADPESRFVPIRCSESSRFEVQRALNRTYQGESSATSVTLYLEQVQTLPADLQQLVLRQLESPIFRHITSTRHPLTHPENDEILPELRPRLSPISLNVPALRERYADLPLLAQQLLEEFNQTNQEQIYGFSPAVEKLFLRYRWPGNLDELSRVVTQSASRAMTHIIDVTDLPLDFNESLKSLAIRTRQKPRSLADELADFETRRIQEALEQAKGNKSIAAEILQVPRARLYRRLAALGLIEDHEKLEDSENDSEL